MSLEHLIPLRCKIDNEGYVTEASRFWGDSDCICDYQDTVEAIQQAHRQGWEQAKRAATDVCENGFKRGLGDKFQGDVFAYAIASMEYKEKANEC